MKIRTTAKCVLPLPDTIYINDSKFAIMIHFQRLIIIIELRNPTNGKMCEKMNWLWMGYIFSYSFFKCCIALLR